MGGTARTFGDVAQLGERMNGIHEVRGSIPLVSTNRIYNLKALVIECLLLVCESVRC